ncbi:hypothetical protein AEA09_06145 [Lysinibacillus contaminans]|uniref:dUTPase-like domain-containing protein n=2 Tax=Lysinibacillus contaminans TaxID=1293441 RepID=A0ABR5K4P9_9BACI|nr:hypothetical protein AEA09_06145 [Lysinibacillus contaminans]
MEETMLSNRDIFKEIIKAKDLAIHPLKLENINGSSINLTASEYAWYSAERKVIGDGASQTQVEIPGTLAANNGVIKIPRGETVNILTQEAIWVSRKISGTYHSRVSLSAKGLSNISTTLDPKWCGLSLISMTNNSKYDQSIDVGDGIVTLTFDYLNKKASKDHVEIAASRQDIYKRFDMSRLTIDQKQYLDGTDHRTPFRIINNMSGSDPYKQLKAHTPLRKLNNFIMHPAMLLVLGAIIGELIKHLPKVIKWLSNF